MDNQDLEELKKYLPRYLESITKKRRHDMYNCPFCGSGTGKKGTPALNVYENGTKWKCFSCGVGGDIINLYYEINHLADTPENFKRAVTALSEMFHTGFVSAKTSQSYQPTGKIGSRTHIYHNADGSIFGKKVITSLTDGGKTLCWYRYDPETKTYDKGLKGLKAPLYNAHALQSASEGTVFITEGEKDADTMSRLDDIPATTIPNGAGFNQWIDLYNDGLQGKDIIILTDNDDAGRKYGNTVARNVFSIAKSVKIIPAAAIWDKCPEKGDISDIVQAIGAEEATRLLADTIQKTDFYTPESEEPEELEQVSAPEKEIQPLDAKKGYEFEKKNIRYIWYPYIPAGDYTVLMAAGGTGKTYFACGVAATISRGEALPVPPEYAEKQIIPQNRNVLIISAEDRGSDIWERLEKSGADAEYIRIVDKTSSNGFLFPKDSSDTDKIQVLERTIEKYHPDLIIIDPWHAFCPPEIDVNRINHVRPVFQTISAICEKYDCGLILISHVNKRAQENANNAALGSVDLVNASRSALTVISDSRDQNSRLVIQTKSNHAPHGQTVKFTIDDNGFAWNGFEPNLTKDTLEEAAKMHRKATELIKDTPDYAELKKELLDLITELAEHGKETGIAYRQLENMCEDETFSHINAQEKKKLIDQIAQSDAFKSRGLSLVDYTRNIPYTDSSGTKKRARGFIVSCMTTPDEMAAAMPK